VTEEEIGYQDAIRQVYRSLQRRLKNLQEQLKSSPEEAAELKIRISEVEHLMRTVESLHR
jgi:hypothetical protein